MTSSPILRHDRWIANFHSFIHSFFFFFFQNFLQLFATFWRWLTSGSWRPTKIGYRSWEDAVQEVQSLLPEFNVQRALWRQERTGSLPPSNSLISGSFQYANYVTTDPAQAAVSSFQLWNDPNCCSVIDCFMITLRIELLSWQRGKQQDRTLISHY